MACPDPNRKHQPSQWKSPGYARAQTYIFFFNICLRRAGCLQMKWLTELFISSLWVEMTESFHAEERSEAALVRGTRQPRASSKLSRSARLPRDSAPGSLQPSASPGRKNPAQNSPCDPQVPASAGSGPERGCWLL